MRAEEGSSTDPDRSGFPVLPFSTALAIGAVQDRSARIWLRSARSGPVEVAWRRIEGGESAEARLHREVDPATDRTLAVDIPGPHGEPLRPDTAYAVRASQHEAVLGVGRFRTAPPSGAPGPDRFGIGLWSCHLPFDEEGRRALHTDAMLDATIECFERHDVRFAIEIGDQMYSDAPCSRSLFVPEHFRRIAPPGRGSILECTEQEILDIYRRRYRVFWESPKWWELHRLFPSYPMLDDHEIVDNWGSDPAHREEAWQRIGRCARRAHLEYQASRYMACGASLPESFDHGFHFGRVSVYLLDLRSNRRAGDGARLFSASQLDALTRFLEETREQEALFLGLSIPIAHVPARIASALARMTPDGEDFSDRWSTAGHRTDRDTLLQLLHREQRRSPQRRIVLLCGDIHVGAAHVLHWPESDARLVQLVSSGFTRWPTSVARVASKLAFWTNWGLDVDRGRNVYVRRLADDGEHRANPYGGLNVGVVEVSRENDETELRFLLYTMKDGRPECAYRSVAF